MNPPRGVPLVSPEAMDDEAAVIRAAGFSGAGSGAGLRSPKLHYFDLRELLCVFV